MLQAEGTEGAEANASIPRLIKWAGLWLELSEWKLGFGRELMRMERTSYS